MQKMEIPCRYILKCSGNLTFPLMHRSRSKDILIFGPVLAHVHLLSDIDPEEQKH